MSIQQEEILINNYTTGTTLLFFSTHLNEIQDALGIDINPCIVHMNSLGSPTEVSTFDGTNLWSMNEDNIYVPTSSISTNYLTGYSYSQSIPEMINYGKTLLYQDRFEGNVAELYKTIPEVTPNHKEYVFVSYNEIEDMFVNIKLNRTFNTLDTLNVYNSLVNSMPVQESNTGVVFGRLMARQEIEDLDGNKISIPLRNVPIGIFNSSEDYPTSTSVDDNGDRIFLNIKENSNENDYFNFESFSADTSEYLKSASQFENVPDHYKYITTTNENGEFIIYDVPVGNQIAVFEVDLFKQGLTKDEIALNFFPFPSSDSSPLDSIPSYSFKQFPISVVPAWGTIQTGYTELNITVNYDLRKWTTYYVPPVSYDGKKIGSIELSNFYPTLNIDIRDMSKEGFPQKNIPVVEIHDIYNKDESQTLLWESEFAQLKKTVKFYEHGFKAFKVRANMYDPEGFRTDTNGIPRTHPSSKGVWLSGYQFKLYYNQPDSIFRATGFQLNWGFEGGGGWRGRDNFHLNRGEASNLENTEAKNQTFAPYDRPWDHNYPNKYSIPSRPVVKNFDRHTNVGRLPSSPPYYLEQPEYKDGDLIGLTYSEEQAGGYGFQYSWDSKNWFNNRFSKEVTASYIYKYESRVAWNEKYSNNFQPSDGSPFSEQSSVVNGEKYQRVECGYGYWLRPGGWPPTVVESWGDTVFALATNTGFGASSSFGPGVIPTNSSNGDIKVQGGDIYVDVHNINDQDSSLALDFNATFSEGGLDLYRIIDPSDRMPQGSEVIPTYATFNFSDFYFQRGINQSRIKTGYSKKSGDGDDRFFSKLSDPGNSNHAYHGYNNLRIRIKNNGSIDAVIDPINIKIEAGQTREFNMQELPLDGKLYKFPGNSMFDFATNKYTVADYSITFLNIKLTKNDGSDFFQNKHNAITSRVINGTKVPAEVEPNYAYTLTTSYGNVRTSHRENNPNKGCAVSGGSFPLQGDVMDVRMNGALFQVPDTSGGGYIKEMRFIKNGISDIKCTGVSLKQSIHSISFQQI